jgi:hypothetical protein
MQEGHQGQAARNPLPRKAYPKAVKVVRDHQHIERLIERIDSIGPRGIGGGRKHILLAANLDNIGRMSAASPLGAIGMDRPSLECGNGVFNKTAFIQRI